MNDIDWEYLLHLPDHSPKAFIILRHVSQGLSYQQIATVEPSSYQTIKNTVWRVRQRVGANNIAHLIALSYQVGIL